MAPELLYLIFLFTIIYTGSTAQDNNASPKIKAGLHLTQEPFRIDAYPSDPLLLDCNVEVTDQSLLPLKYIWQKNGENVVSKRTRILQNGSLLIEPYKKVNRQRFHNGIYECKVTTALGDTAITRQVKVVFARIDRKYTSNPEPTDAFEGGAAQFRCNITAEPSPKIQWIKDNSNLNQLTLDNDRYTILPAGILQISPVRVNDSGLYWCNSRFNLELDRFGKIETSNTARLTVIQDTRFRSPKLLAPPRDVDVEVGKSAIFECLVDGNPLPKVEWKKRGSKDAIIDGRLYGYSNLRIPHVTVEHAGIYECLVFGPSGPSINASATLNVLVPPKLEKNAPLFVLPLARSKAIECDVSGKPKPQISWFYNGNRIGISQGNSNFKIKNGGSLLQLYNLRTSDSGYYQCVASNEAGVVISLTRIILEKKGTAPDRPRNVTAVAISSTVIRVSVEFSPDTEYSLIQYRVPGEDPNQEVLNLRGKELHKAYKTEIKDLKPYTNYSVEIQALTSKDGVSDYSDKVYVRTDEDVPTAAPSLSLTNPNYHTILVSWTPLTSEQSRGKVVKYRIFFRAEDALEVLEDVPADQTSFYIRDVEPETTYYIQVQAATGAGFPPRDISEAMKHVTPAVNASSPPRLTLKYINDSAVKLSWQSPASFSNEDKVIGYNFNITNLNDEIEKSPLKHFSVDSSVHSKNVTGLNSYDEYEVTLVAVMKTSFSGTSSRKFQLRTLKLQPEPWHFSVADITAHNISLVWTPVINSRVEYEICHSKEEEETIINCSTMFETSWTVENLDPYTRYLFRAKALLADEKEHFSKNLIVRTRADRPSPPMNLLVEVVKPKVVHLQWLPPLYKNGLLQSYIVRYSKKEEGNEGDVVWKSLPQKSTSTSSVIEDLEVGMYLFTVIAVNSVGLSKPSHVVSAVPVCLEESELSCQTEVIPVEEPPKTVEIPWNKKASLPTKAIWIIVAFIGFMVLIVVGIIIFCLYKRRRRQQPGDTSLNSSHTPFFPGNGHVRSAPQAGHTRPWNGPEGSPHGVGYGPGDVMSPQEFAPMLNQIRENVHLDSKGGTDTIIPNGLYHNGLIRPNNKPASFELQTAHLKNNLDPEEHKGLMAAIIENNGVRKGLQSSSSKHVEEISMSCLDIIDKEGDADRNDEEEGSRDGLVDHSSEDSGTECRHAGMHGSREDPFHAQSPASSPGESSLDPQHQSLLENSLLVWERKDSQIDEIDGHFMDRATGAVIGPIASLPDSSKSSDEGREDLSIRPCRTSYEDDDESASNDRDSGHGGEVKSQGGATSSMCDSGHAEIMCDVDNPHASSIPGDLHSSVHCLSSSRAASTASSLLPSQPSQQQLPLSSSRSRVSPGTNSHPQRINNQSRPNMRNLRQPHIDLPLPPPPPPPPPQSTVLTPPYTSAETVARTSENNDSSRGSSAETVQDQTNGSSDSRQSQVKIDVAFSPPRPPPGSPNIS